MAEAPRANEVRSAHEATPLEPQRDLVKEASVEIRRGFVQKVYGILAAQLLLTTWIAAPIYTMGLLWVRDHQWILFMSMLVLIATMCSTCCCMKSLREYPTNYIFLFTLTGAMSVMVGFSSAMYTWQSVLLSAGITFGIFVCMTIYACTTTTDFTGMGPYMFAAMCAFFMFGLAISIMSMSGIRIDWLIMLYDALSVLFFSFYIVFDTQLILGELGGHRISFGIDDYVFAALNLYLDIVNLFLHILAIMGQRR